MDDESKFEEDYYAFFNVSKEASADEIRNAFKLLSRRFHPDKHTDPALKSAADAIFNRMKKIYDVLSDPKKRSIYDTLGVNGLEREAGVLIEKKYMSSQQIKEEYEQLIKDREARALMQRCNPRGTITMLIDATEFFQHDDDDDDDDESRLSLLNILPSIEVRSMSIQQSIEAPLTSKNNILLHGNLNVRNGNGNGQLSCIWRHIYSPLMWGELELGAGGGPLATVKVCRNFRNDISVQFQLFGVLTPIGIVPGLNLTVNRQFSKNLVGYMSYREGQAETALTTAGVYENEWFRFNTGLTLGLRQSFISTSYTHKFNVERELRLKVGAKFGTMGAFFEYGGEGKISPNNNLGLAMSIGTHTGVTLRVKLVRNTQTFIFPIVLADQILPSSIIVGTLLPIGIFFATKKLLIDPLIEHEKEELIKLEKEQNSTVLDERRLQSKQYQELMNGIYTKIVDEQTTKNGLYIVRAVYGNPAIVDDYIHDTSKQLTDDCDAIDVTVAVQVMINEQSQNIFISDRPKSFLPGFCDCFYGKDKSLSILYRFNQQNYSVQLSETESAVLPSKSHLQ